MVKINSVAEKLRERMAKKEFMIGACAWDVISAKMIEKAGYDFVAYLSGIWMSVRGYYDAKGVVSPNEVADYIYKVTQQIDIPLLVDMERGGETIPGALHWLHQNERAGCSWIYIDDHLDMEGAHAFAEGAYGMVPVERNIEMIKAFVKERETNIVIGARTQAWRMNADEQIRRSVLYKEAGADVIHLVGVKDQETLRRVRREIDGPLLAQVTPPGYVKESLVRAYLPSLTFDELKAEGIQFHLNPRLVNVAYKATWDALNDIKAAGHLGVLKDRLMPHEQSLSFLE
jgi:2-methylisocitrate lyase-like PEP mutase family enzyme